MSRARNPRRNKTRKNAYNIKEECCHGAGVGRIFCGVGRTFPRAAQTEIRQNMKRIPFFVLVAAAFATLCAGVPAGGGTAGRTAPQKVAVVVVNDSGNRALDSKTKAFEKSLSARLSGAGFGIVDYDLAVRNLNDYLGDPNAKFRSAAAALKRALDSKESAGSTLISDASGVRLGGLVGADYILSVSVASYSVEKRNSKVYGVATENTVYKLRTNSTLHVLSDVAYSVAGLSLGSEKTLRNTADISVSDGGVMDELVADAVERTAEFFALRSKSEPLAAPVGTSGEIEILFTVEGLDMPEIVRENGKYALSKNTLPVSVSSVSAEIDGIAQTLGGKISLPRGIHTLVIRQSRLEPLEKNINITGASGQRLTFSLRPDAATRAAFKADAEFVEEMKKRAMASDSALEISAAEAERIRGAAKMYEQSGFKVDAKALPEINKTQSIFGQ